MPGLYDWQRVMLWSSKKYREGDEEFIKDQWQVPADAPVPPPEGTPWGPVPLMDPIEEDNMDVQTDAGRYRFPRDDGGGAPRAGDLGPDAMREARGDVRAAAKAAWKTRLRFRKTLGWGGNGIATLWQWRGVSDREPVRWLVMKSSIQGSVQGIVQEKAWYHRLSRAPHVVQLFRFADQAAVDLSTGRRSVRIQAAALADMAEIDAARSFYFMEYAKMGTLQDVCKRANQAEIGLPPQVLWRFFDCLVKGCFAMQYLPRTQPANGAALRPGEPVGGRVWPLPGELENGYLPDIPPGGYGVGIAPAIVAARNEQGGGIVHFDCDPGNIFVPGLNTAGPPVAPELMNIDDHSSVPRLQIADFGLAKTTQDLRLPPSSIADENRRADRRLDIWTQKSMAKRGWFAPEQFDKTWEQVPARSHPFRPPGPVGSDVAGNYSEKTNVFQIGMSMWVCMEFSHPVFPPSAVRNMDWELPPLTTGNDQCWTYGRSLLTRDKQDEFGAELCDLVARCLLRTPQQRPSLDELQSLIDQALAGPNMAVQAPFDGSVAGSLFSDPPAPVTKLARAQEAPGDVDPFEADFPR